MPDDEETQELPKSRGQELAETDGKSIEDILDTFGIFYTMRVYKEAIKDLKGLRGKTFRLAFGQRVGEVYSQYSPYDFYGTLKEGTVPDIQRSDLLDSIEAQLEHMKKINEKRQEKGKKLKFPPRTIDTYEEALNDLRRIREEL